MHWRGEQKTSIKIKVEHEKRKNKSSLSSKHTSLVLFWTFCLLTDWLEWSSVHLYSVWQFMIYFGFEHLNHYPSQPISAVIQINASLCKKWRQLQTRFFFFFLLRVTLEIWKLRHRFGSVSVMPFDTGESLLTHPSFLN